MSTTDQFPFPSDTRTDSDHGSGAGSGSGSHRAPSGGGAPETQAAWRIVAGREIMVKLRDRNFIISTLTTLGIMVVAFGVSFFISGQTDSKTLAVASPQAAVIAQQAVEGGDELAGPLAPGNVEVTITEYADVTAAEQAVSDGDADAALVGSPGQWTLPEHLGQGQGGGDAVLHRQ